MDPTDEPARGADPPFADPQDPREAELLDRIRIVGRRIAERVREVMGGTDAGTPPGPPGGTATNPPPPPA